MKQFIYIISILSFFFANAAIAQELADTLEDEIEMEESKQGKTSKLAAKDDAMPKNFLKMNMTSLLLGNLSFQYERALAPRLSAALGLRWMPQQKLPLQGFAINMIDRYVGLDSNASDIEEVLGNIRLRGMVITPELRFYFRKHQRGLYLGLMGRLENYTGVYDNFELTVDGGVQNANLKARYQSLGAGILLGSQFKLSKNFYLDWWIVGPYITNSKLKLDLSGYSISEDDFREVEQQLQDVSLDNDYFTTSIMVGRTNSSVKMQGNLMGLRAMGLCLSFRF